LKVKANDKRYRLADRLRNLAYPLVPAIAVSTIWAIAWARSVESKVAAECGPLRIDSLGNVTSPCVLSPDPLTTGTNADAVASDDDQRN
jgi:hypothetical protein